MHIFIIMSNAVASARKRRAGIQPEPQVQQNGYNNQSDQMRNMSASSSNGSPAQGLTLQQVISLINTRLLKLEKTVSENASSPSQSTSTPATAPETDDQSQISNGAVLDQLQQIVDEYNVRFSVFSEEIAKLKDTILGLQAFTMEVNKALYQERIQILSEMGSFTETEEAHVEIGDGNV